MPLVLLGFAVIGMLALLYVLVDQYPQRAYLYLAIGILNAAATWLLYRVVVKLRRDMRGGKKRLRRAQIAKMTAEPERQHYILVIEGQRHRVTEASYREYSPGDSVWVATTPAAGIWLGILPVTPANVNER